MFVTFLISGLAHELVMVIVTKKIRSVSVPAGYLHTLRGTSKDVSLYTSGLLILSPSPVTLVEDFDLFSSFKFP
jgi:hypothetical protein